MAADFLKIDRNKIHGNRIVGVADKLIELRAMVASEYESVTHMFDGSDFSQVEANFGLEEGTGMSFYVLLGHLTAVLNMDTDIDGTERKQWLDEFTARLGGQ